MSLPTAGTEKRQVIGPSQKFQGLTGWVTQVIHLPGGKRIMACSNDRSLRVWNLENEVQIGNDWSDGGEAEAYRIALSPDGKKIISTNLNGVMKLWDVDSGKVITKWEDICYSICWSQDGGRILSRFSDGIARVWDVENGKTILKINTGHLHITIYEGGAIYSPDETMIATGGDNMEQGFLKIWDAKTGEFVKDLKGHTDTVTCLAWTHDTSMLISGSFDHSIRMWNTTTWQQIAILTEHTNLVLAIAISPNGRILASASADSTARLWNLENSHLVGLPLQHPDSVNCLSFSTDGKLLATGCWNSDVYTWDISAIEDDLDNLLVNDHDKTILNDVATQRRNRRRENAHRIPPRFFDDSPRHPHSNRSHRIHLSPAPQHQALGPTLLGRVSLLFRHTRGNAQSTGPRLRPMGWVQNPLSGVSRRGRDQDVELQDHRVAVAHVPFAHGNPRNYSAREARMKEEKAKKKKKEEEQRKKLEIEKARDAENASASSSQLPQSNVAHNSDAAQTHTTSQPPSSSVTPAVVSASEVTASTTSRPGIVIADAGRWTRFRLFICCLSTQEPDSHH